LELREWPAVLWAQCGATLFTAAEDQCEEF
jgi:hypothetical protein